jgi:hypothetical protein
MANRSNRNKTSNFVGLNLTNNKCSGSADNFRRRNILRPIGPQG